ncbi:MAG: alpha-glucosidase [Bacteroidetes bacterium]|nr:alpha-glucosidase [Bacteroidota bacterium]
MENKKHWWNGAVIYQVYPRSFKDSNGDGVGDLPGLIGELDYIASLGVDAVWLNPVNASPGLDNGYDISDFTAIDPQYGTMEDMQQLIDGLHRRGMRIIIDMVLNHTSDEHEWFRQARTSRDNPYYAYYHWWPAEKGEPPHRCGFFDAAGKGWEYNRATDSYYLHYFAPQQPDLNWENPKVRAELYSMLRWWLDKGVDGVRLDAICFISKDVGWPEVGPELLRSEYQNDWGHYYAAGPRLHEYLKEMRSAVFSGYDVVVVGEMAGVGSEDAHLFEGELDVLYHFEGIQLGYMPGAFKKVDPAGYRLKDWKEVYGRWNAVLGNGVSAALYLGNHDQPRMVSRWGDDSAASARLLFTWLLTMKGTPFIYNGDELGMTNIRLTDISQYRDVETHRMYENLRKKGGDAAGFLADQQLTGRDNGRTPFQWSAGAAAGFTDGEPWIAVNPNFNVVNREVEEGDGGSVLSYVRWLLRIRRSSHALVYGGYEELGPSHPHVYAYKRVYADEEWTVVLNFSAAEQEWGRFVLAPWEPIILKGKVNVLQGKTTEGR